MTRPKCMCCDKPLAKQTRTRFMSHKDLPWPADKAEAQRRVNEQVVRVTIGKVPIYRRAGDIENPSWRGATGRHDPDAMINTGYSDALAVSQITTWDGESYGLDGEGLFCTLKCAALFGTTVAKRIKAQRAG